ncbi:MAG: 2-oxoacid:acceptor oxidoreductase subunit alpha [Bacteroidales bacterium]
MTSQMKVKELERVVIRFSGDSGDGMQLVGTIFSNLSAILGNEISTFPDFPAEIRAPQGSLSGVSGFQVHLGSNRVLTPGDTADVLVAMNPAALKVNKAFIKQQGVVIIDQDSFAEADLKKALFETNDPFSELGMTNVQVISAPITSMTRDGLQGFGLDNKSILRCKNMFALGLICWLFNREVDQAVPFLKKKFSKKEAIMQANIKALTDGFNFGNNTHATVSTFTVEATSSPVKGLYTDVNGNTATAYGLIAASENSGLPLFLGSYPITPATDILQELAKRKDMGVKTVQCEDEIAGICTAIGASFAGNLAATNTSGPGLALKGEAIGLAVMAELPLVIVDVQRGGPSTGLPTKTEQSDLMQALYGRNGESPLVVVAAKSPTHCFDSAYWAAKLALEHMTPVICLTDGFIANGTSAWMIPDMDKLPTITPRTVTPDMVNGFSPYGRDVDTLVRQWAHPGTEGFMHRIGGLEKDYNTGVISTDADNHQKMTDTREAKIEKIADHIPSLQVEGDPQADLLVVGWGGTYGHLSTAVAEMNENGKPTALAHFEFINPMPANAREILKRYKKVVVCELNLGQFASYIRMKVPTIELTQYNKVQGQPFAVSELVECFTNLIEK